MQHDKNNKNIKFERREKTHLEEVADEKIKEIRLKAEDKLQKIVVVKRKFDEFVN